MTALPPDADHLLSPTVVLAVRLGENMDETHQHKYSAGIESDCTRRLRRIYDQIYRQQASSQIVQLYLEGNLFATASLGDSADGKTAALVRRGLMQAYTH
jgi:hypothetical protein